MVILVYRNNDLGKVKVFNTGVRSIATTDWVSYSDNGVTKYKYELLETSYPFSQYIVLIQPIPSVDVSIYNEIVKAKITQQTGSNEIYCYVKPTINITLGLVIIPRL